MSARPRRRGIWAAAATTVVIAGLAAALAHLGRPAERRLRILDEQRITDLQALSGEIRDEAKRTGEIPTSLESIEESPAWPRWSKRDPVTEEVYAYEIVAEDRFRLCADFARATPPGSLRPGDRIWTHPQGRFCFDFAVTFPKGGAEPGCGEPAPTEIPRTGS